MSKNFARTKSCGSSERFRLLFSLTLAMTIFCLSFQVGEINAAGFALSGVGSKAIGMGGAFRGLADDWSAAYWNPAGLTQLEESQVGGMLVFLSPRPEYNPGIRYGGLDVGYRNGQTVYPHTETNVVPDFSGFIKLDAFENYTVGVAVYVPVGFNSEWDLFNPRAGMDIRNPYPLYDHVGKLKVMDIHPTIARSFMDDKLSLGAGLSIIWGDITFQKTILKPFKIGETYIPVPHQNLLIDTDLEGDGWGYGANFGGLYKFSDKFQIGLSGKLPTTLTLDGTAAQELYTMDNEEFKNILLGNAFTAADSARVRGLFGDANLASEPNAEAEFKFPGDIGFGFAAKPNEKITITGEVAITYWSALDSVTIELDGVDPTGAPAENSVIMFLWDDVTRFSLGAEYQVADPFVVRLGYYFDPSPIPDSTFTPLIPDLGDKNSFNIGVALTLGGVEISYNYEYLTFSNRTISELIDVDTDGDEGEDGVRDEDGGDGAFDNYPGDYKMDLHASHLSLTYRF